MSAIIAQLARRQLLWQGNNQQAAYQALSSGFAELDARLGGGFPASGLIELQTAAGIGELRLMLPYLKQQQASGRLLVLIAPPAEPCADMLAAAGIDLSALLIIAPTNNKDMLWTAEQCLHSGCCASVLLWQPQLNLAQARRLQLAAEHGAASLIVLRKPAQYLSLPVNLSLALTAKAQGLSAKVLKRKGGWAGEVVDISMQPHWPVLCLADSSEAHALTAVAG